VKNDEGLWAVVRDQLAEVAETGDEYCQFEPKVAEAIATELVEYRELVRKLEVWCRVLDESFGAVGSDYVTREVRKFLAGEL